MRVKSRYLSRGGGGPMELGDVVWKLSVANAVAQTWSHENCRGHDDMRTVLAAETPMESLDPCKVWGSESDCWGAPPTLLLGSPAQHTGPLVGPAMGDAPDRRQDDREFQFGSVAQKDVRSCTFPWE